MRSRYGSLRYYRAASYLHPRIYKSYGCGVKKNRTYTDAIELLNKLQSSPDTINARKKHDNQSYRESNERLKVCLLHMGYSVSDLDNLNIIHVAGTKGKGSTCAYVDSILNQYRLSPGISLKVGLYTSPHLISVRERIKINSYSISPNKFAKYFFQVWDRFEQPQNKNGSPTLLEIPSYFRYLTLLSYHVFIQEQVNLAIYEVGIGGEYDSTNLVERPLATGISKIGIDHTSVLGNTISEIAWHKSGILKKNCPSFYVDQEPMAVPVINKRAEERQVKSSQNVAILPQMEMVKIQPNAEFQKQNATLACYLSHNALVKFVPNYNYTLSSNDPLPEAIVNGLEKVVWRGRCEKIEEETLIWYLDGAHNSSSIKVAVNWFKNELPQRIHSIEIKSSQRILIFNQQGRRDLMNLLDDLYRETKLNQLQFDHVIFCPTEPVQQGEIKDCVNYSIDRKSILELTQQKLFAKRWDDLDQNGAKIHVLHSLEDSLQLCRSLSTDAIEKSHVLITGSLHLVGRALGTLGVELV